jgi:hypothetical protein
MGRFAALLKTAGEIAYVAKVLRAPLFISLLGSVCLFLPDQTREVYRILAQPSRSHGWIQLSFAILMALLATLAPWLVGRELTFLYAKDLLRQQGLAGKLSRWLPRICGALIPFGLAIGLIIASREIAFELPDTVVGPSPDLALLRDAAGRIAFRLKSASALCFLLAAVLLVGTFLRTRRGRHARRDAPLRWYSGTAGLVLLTFVVAASVLLSFAPVTIPQAMGALAILLVFLVAAVLLAGVLTAYFDRYHVPAISCILLLAILFSAFDLNDNHAVRFEKREPASLPPAREALASWLDTRADKDYYGDKPYPVIFVTAAGGGMYAAYHAATVLARLQDRCPNFAQHVFSISAVSGGSLGAAVFAGLAKHYSPNIAHQDCQMGPAAAGPVEHGVQRYFLDADLLAPVVAASLFPDFLQRFLPLRLGRLDRARALEATLADAWPRAAPDAGVNPFATPFLAQRDEKDPGPALILNTTDVEHGYRVAITPFEIVSLGMDNVPSLTKIIEFHNAIRGTTPPTERKFDRDITLGTAVGLSARFPWLLPAGRVPRAQHDLRIVDGGYIDNSGAETTLDLLRSLHTSYRGTGPRKISVYIIAISSIQLVETSSWQGIGEILSPIRTMLSTRDSRGSLGIYHASNFPDDCLADKLCNSGEDQFRIFPLNLLDFPIPLGWQLSPISARLIGLHSGLADEVNGALAGSIIDDKPDLRIFGYVNMANESSCAVQKILQRPSGPYRCVAY